MDNCVDAMIIINEDGVILDFNQVAKIFFSKRRKKPSAGMSQC